MPLVFSFISSTFRRAEVISILLVSPAEILSLFFTALFTHQRSLPNGLS